MHASIANCGGYGITVNGGSSFSGNVCNSVIWNNTAGNVLGVAASAVFSSCSAYAAQNNNFIADPQFADQENVCSRPVAANGCTRPGQPDEHCLAAA